MALILRLERRKMPALAKNVFMESEEGRVELLIPAMVFSEVAYLAEKGRIEVGLKEVELYLLSNLQINEHPLTLQTVKVAFEIDDVPELHDRLTTASTKETNAVLITDDPAMEKSSHVRTLWKTQ